VIISVDSPNGTPARLWRDIRTCLREINGDLLKSIIL